MIRFTRWLMLQRPTRARWGSYCGQQAKAWLTYKRAQATALRSYKRTVADALRELEYAQTMPVSQYERVLLDLMHRHVDKMNAAGFEYRSAVEIAWIRYETAKSDSAKDLFSPETPSNNLSVDSPRRVNSETAEAVDVRPLTREHPPRRPILHTNKPTSNHQHSEPLQ